MGPLYNVDRICPDARACGAGFRLDHLDGRFAISPLPAARLAHRRDLEAGKTIRKTQVHDEARRDGRW